MKRFKFLNKGFKSVHGEQKWKVGQWYKYDGDLEMCKRGFHCSKGIYQAFSYVQGEVLAEVEVKGKHLSEEHKEVWQEMRLIKARKWTKTDSVLFAIYAARLVLDIFEKYDSDDKHPREAVEAAERYIKSPTKKNKDAAAHAAYAAAYAAVAAAHAADAAYAAAYAAVAAAHAAAHAAIYKKLDRWMLKHLVELKENNE